MPKAHSYKFCFGPWNISEGQDPYGPPVRQPQTFEWKLAQLKQHGFDAMMFHDDDAVPELDGKSAKQITKEARELKKRLDGLGIAAEMVAPRLWFHPNTVDGAYTSNDPKCRAYAIERSKISIDIAHELDTDVLVLWLAREGSYIRESKNARRCVDYLVEAFDQMLGYDKGIRLAIEPKPNEPMDHAYIPTIGHALAIAQLTSDAKRVGCLIESAHAILAGLDPSDEIDFACAFGKLWSLHLNDQNGLKFDQDKPFGTAPTCAWRSTRSGRSSATAMVGVANTCASMSTRSGPPVPSTGSSTWVIHGTPSCVWSTRPAPSRRPRPRR